MWVHEVSTNHPDTVFRVVSALPGDEDGQGVGVVEVDGEGYEKVLEEVPHHKMMAGMEVLWKDDEEQKALIQIHTRDPLILRRASRSGVPIEMPFEIQDGVGEWTLKASHESLSELGSTFDSIGIEYDIEYLRDFGDDGDILTEKQRKVIEVAHGLG